MIDKGISYDIPQLAKPKGDGRKRQGYRGEAAAASDAASGRDAGRSDTGSASGRGDGPATGGGGDNNREQYSVKRTVTPKTQEVNIGPVGNVQRDTGLERQRKLNEDILDKFKKTRPEINVPEWSILTKILENPLQKFSDWSTAKNREYFENVIRAGNIPGLNFANLTDIDIEQAYQDYMDSRLSGEIDAMGRPRIDYNLDDNKDKRGTTTGILENLLLENILSPVDTTPSPTGFNYVPYSNQVVIAPGIEGLRSLIGSNAFKSIIK